MSSSGPTNGTDSKLSPAEQLKAKHAAAGGHNVEMEEVVDEEDIAHPPPVAGPAQAGPSAPKAQKLNFNSEEAFPSLGPSKPAPRPQQSWSRPPANGTKGKAPASNVAANASVSLPGRAIERIVLAPSQVTPRAQLKRPIPDLLKDISKKFKARVEMKEGTDGRLVFEGIGTQEAVRSALKEVANVIGSKQSVKIAVPLSVLPYLIGRQGATIQAIGKRSGARIQIPKHDSSSRTHDDEEDDATVDITVEGDAVAAEMARSQIQKIVDERTSNISMRLKDVPPEYYPFLAGPRQSNIPLLSGGNDLNINIPHYHTWSSAPPAKGASGKPAPFIAQDSHPIRIAGDRQAAQQARERIEQQVEQLKRQLTSHEVPIERGRHQFIIGSDGDGLHDFLAETGCSIVLPPDHDDTELLYVIGPPSQIDNAVNRVMDMASSMAVSNVDVARQFVKAPPSHAYNVARYLQERRAIAALEREFGANFVLPTSPDAPATWQIFSRDGKAAMKARADAMGLIAGHPPTRFHPLQVNPFFHPHLQTQARQIRQDSGVHLLFPPTSIADSHDLILIYENPGSPSEYVFPRQAPSPDQTKEIQRAIQEVLKQIAAITGDNDIVVETIDTPPKYHEKVGRFVKKQGASSNSIPPQLLSQRGNNKGLQLRGRTNDVQQLSKLIEEFIEQEKKDELERGFTTSFEFPHKFAGHLVGKRGENIKKLQDEYDVEIHYTENKVDLKGPQAKCQAAKTHILSLAKKLDDETTHAIKIPAQYHGDIKGAKGSQVLRLQERYNVRINFPRSAQANTDDGDDVTEKSFRGQPSQGPDVVIIKGTKKGADEARDELLSLLQYTQDNSHTSTVSVSAKQIPSLIGSGGRELDSLRLQTGCIIDMPKKDDVGSDDRVEVKLRGTKQAVEAAKKVIQQRAKTFDDTVSETLNVEPQFHKLIIGPSGATLTKLILEAGGPDDRREMNRIVQFPKAGTSSNEIRLQGPKAVITKLKAAIQAIVSEKSGQVEETVEVPPEQHRNLIGPGGATRRKIESDFKVELIIPKADVAGPERAKVRIIGSPENIQKTKEHITGLVKEQASTTINVPRKYHHIVSDDGSLFRRLRNDYGINVDHAGQKPPPKSVSKATRGRANGSAAPLITDDPSEQSSHSWEVVDNTVPDGDTAPIPWVLRGNSEKLTKAQDIIEKALESASKPSSTGYLILADPKLYRFVIGPQGSVVNGIRSQTGTQVTVPRQSSASEAIEVKGSKDDVEKAKELILEALAQGGRR